MRSAQREIGEMRQELKRLRRDLAAWKTPKPDHSKPRPDRARAAYFIDTFQTAVAYQLRNRYEFFRIEARVAALEKRITALEEGRRAASSSG